MNAQTDMLCAGISIGSHATRFLIADVQKDTYYPLFSDRAVNQLFGDQPHCELSAEQIRKTSGIVEGFTHAAREAGCERIDIIATSACRDAQNTSELQHRIFCGTKLRLQIIAGEEEARLGYAACRADGACGVIDIGGGSTEIIGAAASGGLYCVSIPIGADRLAASGGNADTQRAALNGTLEKWLPTANIACSCRGERDGWFGLGGTCRCLLALENAVSGEMSQTLTFEAVGRWREKLGAMTAEERRVLQGMRPHKENVIPFGAQILEAVMERLMIRSITVSRKNELDGWMQKIADQA